MRCPAFVLLLILSACGSSSDDASAPPEVPAEEADVESATADTPSGRLDQISAEVDAWAPDNNTFPSLPSHPMRIVGWASLSQDASLETAIEYAGHAELHVDISRDALDAC